MSRDGQRKRKRPNMIPNHHEKQENMRVDVQNQGMACSDNTDTHHPSAHVRIASSKTINVSEIRDLSKSTTENVEQIVGSKDKGKLKKPKEEKPKSLGQSNSISDSIISSKSIKTDRPRCDKAVVDPVIEQWYVDPYNRHNPEGLADIALRKQVLRTALRNRGFRGPRVDSIVNWLVRCRGRYQDFDVSVKNLHRHKPRKQALQPSVRVKQKSSTPAADLLQNKGGRNDVKTPDHTTETVDSGASAYPSPVSIRDGCDDDNFSEFDCESTSKVSTTNGNIDTTNLNNATSNTSDHFNTQEFEDLFADTDTETNIEEDNASNPSTNSPEHAAALQHLKQEITCIRPDFNSAHAPGTEEYEDDYLDWYIESLKRTVSFWNIIYGDDLDDPEAALKQTMTQSKADIDGDEDSDDQDANEITDKRKKKKLKEGGNVKFTYFRNSYGMPSPDVQYPTQGLKPMKRVFLAARNEEVWTEDATFGLYKPAQSERIEVARAEKLENGVGVEDNMN